MSLSIVTRYFGTRLCVPVWNFGKKILDNIICQLARGLRNCSKNNEINVITPLFIYASNWNYIDHQAVIFKTKATMKFSETQIPRLGLGMAALGRPGYINLNRESIFGDNSRSIETMQSQANLVLDSLFENAVDAPWIDCARSYGLSEKFLGEYLKTKNIPADKVYVSRYVIIHL